MGNCCQAKDSSPKNFPAQSVIKFLKIKSKALNFSYKFEYLHSRPLISYLNNIISIHPDLILDEITVQLRNQQIIDFNLTLKDLEIVPSDMLLLETRIQRKKKKKKRRKRHVEEDRKTTTEKVKTESTGEATLLWRSAVLANKFQKIKQKENEISLSIANDANSENRLTMRFLPYDIFNGQSVLIDSDDSIIKGEVKSRSSLHRPHEFFADLQGPFSIINNF